MDTRGSHAGRGFRAGQALSDDQFRLLESFIRSGFVVQPRRWVVERTLGRWRRLSKDYEELPEVFEAMVTLALIRLMLHRLAHPKRLPVK